MDPCGQIKERGDGCLVGKLKWLRKRDDTRRRFISSPSLSSDCLVECGHPRASQLHHAALTQDFRRHPLPSLESGDWRHPSQHSSLPGDNHPHPVQHSPTILSLLNLRDTQPHSSLTALSQSCPINRGSGRDRDIE